VSSRPLIVPTRFGPHRVEHDSLDQIVVAYAIRTDKRSANPRARTAGS